jgi:uncharacterized alkaline shock family protein YloU
MEETTLGRVEVAPLAIASLVSQAVLESYGVVGMATKDLARGIVEILQPAGHRRGVEVRIDGDQVVIDVFVVIEYGTPIATIARNIQSAVSYTLQRGLGTPVSAINVHVQDLRLSAD